MITEDFNFTQEYRRYKIAKFFGKPINKEAEELIVFIQKNIIGLEKFNSDKKKHLIYYGKNRKNLHMCECL